MERVDSTSRSSYGLFGRSSYGLFGTGFHLANSVRPDLLNRWSSAGNSFGSAPIRTDISEYILSLFIKYNRTTKLIKLELNRSWLVRKI